MSIRSFICIALLALLSSCALFGHGGNCNGGDCYHPKKFENTQAFHQWYCYGKQSGSWHCQNKPDKKLIVAVTPKIEAPVNPDQIPGANIPLESRKDVHIGPLTDITNSILNQSDKSYTVQLTASHSRQELKQYAEDHDVTQPMYVVVPGDNGPTYVMLLGVFKDQDHAIDARELWERTRRIQEEPWVRKLGPLQKAIQAKQQDGD